MYRACSNLMCIVLICFFGCPNVTSQELTKDKAVTLVLENNYGIQIAKNQVTISDNNQKVLNSGYLPSLNATAGGTYQRSSAITTFPDAVDQDGNPRPDNEQIGVETRRYNAGISMNYTVFDGFGRYYNYKRLKEQYDLTELQAREVIENTIIQLFEAYYQVARLSENTKVREEVLNISRDRVKRAQYRFEYGQTNKLDVLNAKVDVVNDSIFWLQTDQQLQNAYRNLAVVLNDGKMKKYKVDTTLQFIPKERIEGFMSTYKDYNVTILQNKSQVQLSEYDLKITKSQYVPEIGLNGTYGWNQSRNPAGAFFPANISDVNSLTAGLSLSWNLFDGGGTITRSKNAKIELENRELQKEQFEIRLQNEITNAYENYITSLKIYDIQEQNVETSTHNFNRSKEEYALGRISSIEFRQAQVNLINAKTNRNLAKYDAKLAELLVLQLTGQLLNVNF